MSKTPKEKKKKKTPKEKKGKTFNLRHERFCQNYVKNRELFGNATLSYANAYDYDLDSLSKESVTEEEWDEDKGKSIKTIIEESEYQKQYNVCSVEGRRLLTYPKINERITKLLNELANDEFVDGELMYILGQKEDLNAKRQAISEYNKVKQRITTKVKVEGLSLKDLFDQASK